MEGYFWEGDIMSNRRREMRIGLNFEGFEVALGELTDEELIESGLMEDHPRRNGLVRDRYQLTSKGGYVPVNNGSGIHEAITDISVGFSHKPDMAYLNLVRRHH